jgi:hypothetical protein
MWLVVKISGSAAKPREVAWWPRVTLSSSML